MWSAVLFALVWIPRLVLGRLRDVRHLSVRALPRAAVAILVAAFTLLIVSPQFRVADELWGRPTALSVGFWAATWLFAATTAAGLMLAIYARQWDVRRSVRWHALAVSLANAVVLAYLTYWGMIGWRPWT
jgi:hypothetical protein